MLPRLVFQPFAAEKHKSIFQRFHIEVINLRITLITLKIRTGPLQLLTRGGKGNSEIPRVQVAVCLDSTNHRSNLQQLDSF